MVNASETKYNVTAPETYTDLFTDVNTFVGGTVGIGLVMVVWIVTFFSLQNYPNVDAVKASSWVAWMTSVFMTLVGITEPAFTILLFLVVLAVAGFNLKPKR